RLVPAAAAAEAMRAPAGTRPVRPAPHPAGAGSVCGQRVAGAGIALAGLRQHALGTLRGVVPGLLLLPAAGADRAGGRIDLRLSHQPGRRGAAGPLVGPREPGSALSFCLIRTSLRLTTSRECTGVGTGRVEHEG